MVNVQHDVADAIVRLGGVPACTRALVAPDELPKLKSFNLKAGKAAAAGVATGGADQFSPKLRAARLLRALVLYSDAAKAQLAKPPTSAHRCIAALAAVSVVTGKHTLPARASAS
jgi:hypothetical protein